MNKNQANQILTATSTRKRLEKRVGPASIIRDLIDVIDDHVVKPGKKKLQLTPAKLSRNPHFQALSDEMISYTSIVANRFAGLNESQLRETAEKISRIASLDFSEVDGATLRDSLELLGLSESTGLLKTTVVELPKLIISCPSLLTTPPKKLTEVLETVFNGANFNKRISTAVKPLHEESDADGIPRKVIATMIAMLIVEIVAACIVFLCKLTYDFLAASASALATTGVSSAAIVSVVVKNLVVFAAVVILAICAFLLEYWGAKELYG